MCLNCNEFGNNRMSHNMRGVQEEITFESILNRWFSLFQNRKTEWPKTGHGEITTSTDIAGLSDAQEDMADLDDRRKDSVFPPKNAHFPGIVMRYSIFQRKYPDPLCPSPPCPVLWDSEFPCPILPCPVLGNSEFPAMPVDIFRCKML